MGRPKGDPRRPGDRLSPAALARLLLRNAAGRPFEVLTPLRPAAVELRPILRGDTLRRTIANLLLNAAALGLRRSTQRSGPGLPAAAPILAPTALPTAGP